MNNYMCSVKAGLALVFAGLLFGLSLGIGFGANEGAFKGYVADGIATHSEVHDAKSQGKIWRYVQRAHFHALGIAALSLGLLVLVAASYLTTKLKKITAILIGLGSFYPLAWFTMFLLAPSLGRGAAHSHFLTELFTYIGVVGFVAGIGILMMNLFLGMFNEEVDNQ